MTKLLIGFFLTVIILSSCDSKKSYKYVEIVQEEGLLGGSDTKEKDPKEIKAINDSAAYLHSYQNFCISKKVNKDMQASLGKVYSTPIKFKLLNENGQDITYAISFADKNKREKEIEEQIFSMKNSIQESVNNNKKEETENFKQTAKIDSVKMKELSKFFRRKKDEFSSSNKVWYEPKSSPQYTNRNGIYCYFQTEDGMPSNLRLRLQYYADDWLFFGKVQFSIDGKAYEYIPSDTETDSGNGGYIWEWSDEALSQVDREMIYALVNAKSAKMKLIGRQYFDIKTITSEQIASIKRTLQLYHALGGQY
jgi:hypothetical protein